MTKRRKRTTRKTTRRAPKSATLGGGSGAIKTQRKQPKNSKRLTSRDQTKLAEITRQERAARRKYGGSRPERIRDPKYTRTEHIADGDVIVHLDTSAVPEVKITVTERGQPRRGGRREVKAASRTGFWRWRN